jgi:lysophospholipase L1-like esterase
MDLTVRVVAVGDSVSEGVGDPRQGGLHGWVRYLTADPGLELVANLARSGSTVAGVRRHQLDRAVALVPDLVTCAVGVNDVLGRRFDPVAFERDYAHVVGALTAAASRGVLTMMLHDVAAGLPVPRLLRERLRRRITEANSVIQRVCVEHDAWVLDARTAPPLRAAGMLSLDRLHPNRRGHRFIADSALEVLREHAVLPPGPRAAPTPADPFAERVAAGARHILWMARAVRPLRIAPRTGGGRQAG